MKHDVNNHKEKKPAQPRHPGTLKDQPSQKKHWHCGRHKIAPITNGPCTDPLFYGGSQSSETGPKSYATFTISHWEARLCLFIRQVLITIFEVKDVWKDLWEKIILLS
ncbi:hypothetical protein AVEN_142168-1 [Araneus ventricosus]|uniref:Uncharacterized protein n=1 Tax=Araneus ventricosus TaxID=182803 RepID=A0A4Y2Q406_ARAVE|nr:hypothetical protein AVEN_142168-1 [Araneus ventricosus]